jgi:hypothetical protein
VVKYRQLARQVGAFGGFASESSTDFNNMTFSTGSTFNFESWICEVDNEGQLQGCLLENREDQEDLALSTKSTKELTRRLSCLTMSESTLVSPMIEFNSDSRTEPASEDNLGSFHRNPDSFPMRRRNTASIHQMISSRLLQKPSRKLGPLPVGLNNMARSYQDLL